MQRLHAVIFDMDGVLIDSEPLHFEALRRTLSSDAYSLEQAENEAFLGTSTESTLETLVRRHALPGSVAEYGRRYDSAVLDVLAQPHAPQPGVLALIARLRALGLKLGLASSSRRAWIDATLASIGLSDAFDAITAGDDITHSKPDPEIYVLTAQRLGVGPERCVAIEDSPSGVQSAARAGMFVLAVRTAYTSHLPLPGATRIVESLVDVDVSQDVFA
jgi:HAD superfamily hydrolase (TIGR01509 family)